MTVPGSRRSPGDDSSELACWTIALAVAGLAGTPPSSSDRARAAWRSALGLDVDAPSGWARTGGCLVARRGDGRGAPLVAATGHAADPAITLAWARDGGVVEVEPMSGGAGGPRSTATVVCRPRHPLDVWARLIEITRRG